MTRRFKATPQPYRVLDFWAGETPVTYLHSVLMGYGAPQVFGYLGNEMARYDDLWGGKGVYQNQGRTGLWDLWGVRYILFPEVRQFPGYHQVLGPVTTALGTQGFLFERDSVAPYARVVAAAAKVPDDQAIATVTDARFPVRDLVVLSDTAAVDVPAIQNGQLPPLTPVSATVAEWQPGKMHIKLTGTDTRPLWLVVSENWFPDWHALVDGERVQIQRGNYTMLAVPLKPGAKDVDLVFRSEMYRKGKFVSVVALGLTLLLFATSGIGGLAPRKRAA